MRIAVVLATCVSLASCTAAARRGPATPAPAGFDAGRLARIDGLVEAAIKERLLPGAVVVVGHGDETVFVKAYGNRAVVPASETMTPDTVFDVASLTKVVATTTSIMMLVEQGRVRLNDRVSTHIPGFERYGKQDVTVRHLLTHVSGLRPDLDLHVPFEGYSRAIELASDEVLESPPGRRFVYSDINFFLLGEIVARVGGEPLDAFARRHVFEPLGMKDTMFRPPDMMRPRIAPTEPCERLAWPCNTPNAPMLRGIVHDPTARRMDGVAGHAGVFSTAADLARFARMLLRGGELDGNRVLSPLTVAKMIEPASPEDHLNQRALGWDVDSSFSANRGELLPVGSFGHTGFTGTSLWIDPVTRIFVVFLSNRVHPDGKGDVTPLRARVTTAAAAAFVGAPPVSSLQAHRFTGTDFVAPPPTPAQSSAAGRAGFSRPQSVLAGIDILKAEGFARLKGKKIALLTHLPARASDGTPTFDVVRQAPGIQLVSILSPEHGLSAASDTDVTSGRDDKSGLTVHSLYGDTQRPTDVMLKGIDTIVIDLVDVGVRFYTYPTSVAYVMEEAVKRKIAVVVLDRPNPIDGWHIEGPNLDAGLEHFAGYFPMPIRHGLTLGELARLFNAEKKIGADLTVVEARGWERDRWFDDTGLPWSNPSPNMRNLHQATLYPGIGAIEWTNVSVGRGTDTPFEQIGAPWIDGVRLAQVLNDRRIPGIRFYPVHFTPTSSVHANEACRGVFMMVTDRSTLRPVRVGVEIASALHALHPDRFDFKNTVRLLGSQASIDRIRRGDDPTAIATSWARDEEAWRRLRAKYLLYR
jgi:uncharacterized protein YbbC (DUF1343 family)/CubicO group peptidase (beta-lactamase class C family)